MKTMFSNLLDRILSPFSKAWWVKVSTSQPGCTYYFGPFDEEQEAMQAKPGFVEDLEQEGAQSIQASVLLCSKPKELTVDGSNKSITMTPVLTA